MEKLSERWMYYCGLLAVHGVPVDDMKHIQNLIDAEEHGLLLRLPVAIGSEVWKIINQRDNFTDIYYKIVTIVNFRLDMLKEIGKTVFLTKEEAEQALEKMKEV